MKKPIIFSVLFFIITPIFSLGQGVWIEETIDGSNRTGKIEINGKIYEIKSNANLRDANLSGANLSDADLRFSDLSGANLSGANLSGANLAFNEILNVDLSEANLEETLLYGAKLNNVNLTGANLDRANFEIATFKEISSGSISGTPSLLPNGWILVDGVIAVKVWIEESFDQNNGLRIGKIIVNGNVYEVKPDADLTGVNLQDADLSNADLQGSNFINANLSGANLSGTNLSGAYLSEANLRGADLEGADLEGANFINANLSEAALAQANLSGANLVEANLFKADLTGVNLNNVERDALDLYNLNKINIIQSQIAEGGIGGGISPEQAAAIASNTEGVNEVKNAIFIGGSSIIPALLTNDQEQRNSITANTTKIDELDGILTTADETLEAFSESIDTLNENDQSIGEQLTTLGQNDISIGEQIQVLQDWQASIHPQIWDFKSEHDVGIAVNKLEIESNKTEINSIQTEIETMKAQLQTLVASVAEKDAQIAEKDAKIAELEQGGGGQSLEQVLEQVRDARAGSVVLTVDPEGDNITLGLTIEQSDNLIEWTKLDGEMTRTIPIPDGKKFYRFALDN